MASPNLRLFRRLRSKLKRAGKTFRGATGRAIDRLKSLRDKPNQAKDFAARAIEEFDAIRVAKEVDFKAKQQDRKLKAMGIFSNIRGRFRGFTDRAVKRFNRFDLAVGGILPGGVTPSRARRLRQIDRLAEQNIDIGQRNTILNIQTQRLARQADLEAAQQESQLRIDRQRAAAEAAADAADFNPITEVFQGEERALQRQRDEIARQQEQLFNAENLASFGLPNASGPADAGLIGKIGSGIGGVVDSVKSTVQANTGRTALLIGGAALAAWIIFGNKNKR